MRLTGRHVEGSAPGCYLHLAKWRFWGLILMAFELFSARLHTSFSCDTTFLECSNYIFQDGNM